jgi:hypothetical protein
MRQFGGPVFFLLQQQHQERRRRKVPFCNEWKKQQSEDAREIPRRVLTPDEFAEKLDGQSHTNEKK